MALSVNSLASSPRFVEAMAAMAGRFAMQFQSNPRLSRALVCHQRWLLTQASFALYADYALDGSGTGLTATSLSDWVAAAGIASRNTAHHFVENLRAYHFIHVDAASPRRPVRYDIGDQSLAAMHMWFGANLAVLDYVDGGNRSERHRVKPDLLFRVQPEFARRCIADTVWREPSERIGLLQWTECGALVMDHFLELAVRAPLKDGFYDLGVLSVPAMAERFLMSRTHLQRTLKKAEEKGCMARSGPRRGSRTLLSAQFFQEYCAWLAVKSAVLDEVFESVVALENTGVCSHAQERIKTPA
ncbi:hypothetical protein BJF95_14210 [Rhizobium oryziradicis]|uniref:Uncharacterized protein n=2 Tax=Rhizobium oryziradicis TaxID=1867956 RepID=A0A1Q8ZXS2_9HYPH|nr:hypothetical protein BJF95_14210 [Rhizobium oryziradicis]